MTTTGFSVSDFSRASDPWAYILETGILQASSNDVRAELQQLRDEMGRLDGLHIAFALAIAEVHSPELFGMIAADLVSHSDLSVRIKAYRVLRAIAAEEITPTLRAAVERRLRDCPERVEFADALLRA